ncbi:arginase [Sphingobacterium faecium]|uniref:arginase n=1 Tax=Sphingobacterium faecium TaxID=34087 RepID=UPI00320AF519
MKREIQLIKNRSDIGAGTRGSDLGIDAIEIAAINKGSQYFNTYTYVDIQTRNGTIYDPLIYPFGRRIKQVLQQCKLLAISVEDCLLEEKFPLVFSGDHSSAIGTISGIKSAFPDKTLGVIWIDAHADLHAPYTTPSGNLHGMPLAAVLGIDNLENQINDIDEETKKYWNKLKSIGTSNAKLRSEHLIYFGVRDTESPEENLIEKLAIKKYPVEKVRNRSIKVCVADALQQLAACDIVYVSFDVDSMDSELISNGTGTPVPKGFDPTEITEILQEIIASGKVICLELVEVNPLLDSQGNRMAEVAFEILEQVTESIEALSTR